MDAGKVADPSSASTTVTVDADYTLVANFAPDETVQVPTVKLWNDFGVGDTWVGSLPVSVADDGGEPVTIRLRYKPEDGEYSYTDWDWVGPLSTDELGFGHLQDLTPCTPYLVNAQGRNSAGEGDWSNELSFTTLGCPVSLDISSRAGGQVTTPGEGLYTYPPETSVPVSATPDNGYHFARWTGTAIQFVADPTAAQTTVVAYTDSTLVANFAMTTYTLTITAENGSVGRTPDKTQYDSNEVVTLKAEPDTHYDFVGWSGDASGGPETTIVMDSDKSVTANFAPATYTLTIMAENGSVSRTPDKTQYNPNEVVALRAEPDTHYDFVGWSGDASGGPETTIVMDSDKSVTANFQPKQYTLKVSAGPNGHLVQPAGGDSFEQSYPYGTEVPLEAQADAGYQFDHWSGNFWTESNPTTAEMVMDYTITANFAIAQHTLTLSSIIGGEVVEPGEGPQQYDHGQTVTVKAQATLPTFSFVEWVGTAVSAGKVADRYAPTTTVVVDADYTLEALFKHEAGFIYVATVSDPLEDGSAAHPYDSIQKAVDAARDGDTVVLRDGVYADEGNYISIENKSIMIKSEHGSDTCTIDCQSRGWGASISTSSGIKVVLQGLEIANAGQELGAVFATGPGTIEVHDCSVVNCGESAVYGGAGVLMRLSNCRFDNLGNDLLFDNSTGLVDNCRFIGISPINCQNSSRVEVRNCSFSGNGVISYPAITGSSSDITVCDCSFVNYVTTFGQYMTCLSSAIYNPGLPGRVSINRCCFRDNVGVTTVFATYVDVANSVFSGNESDVCCLGGGALEIVNCSILNTEGVGIHSASDGSLNVANSILWGNTSNFLGAPPVVNYSCIQGWTGTLGGAGNFGDDPQLLADGYHLGRYSPCIDAGDPDTTGVGEMDIDGQPRVIGRRIDIGADEFVGTGTLIIERSGLAVSASLGANSPSEAYEDGIHLEDGDASYRIPIPRPLNPEQITRVYVALSGKRGLWADVTAHVGNSGPYEIEKNGVVEIVDLGPQEVLSVLEDNDEYTYSLSIVIGADSRGYDVEKVFVLCEYNDLTVSILARYQAAYGAYCALAAYRQEVVALWDPDQKAQNVHKHVYRGVMEAYQFADNLSELNGSLFGAIKGTVKCLTNLRNIVTEISELSDWVTFHNCYRASVTNAHNAAQLLSEAESRAQTYLDALQTYALDGPLNAAQADKLNESIADFRNAVKSTREYLEEVFDDFTNCYDPKEGWLERFLFNQTTGDLMLSNLAPMLNVSYDKETDTYSLTSPSYLEELEASLTPLVPDTAAAQ